MWSRNGDQQQLLSHRSVFIYLHLYLLLRFYVRSGRVGGHWGDVSA
jgi:hypothetical protein